MGVHGYLMSGQTAAWIRSQMDRKAPSAADGATRLVRPSVVEEDEFARPFEVRFASGDGAEDPGKWIIWLPSDSMLIVNGEPVDLTAELEEAGDPYPAGWYILDFLSEGGGDVFLNVKIPVRDEESGESEGGGEEDEREVSAAFASTADQPEEGYVLYPVKIAECSSDGVKATVSSAIVFGGGGGEAFSPDERSIDEGGGKDGEHKAQIAHFNDSKKDSGKGLEKRLKADPETGEITAQDSDGLMLVARKDGQVIYIPLSGDGKDPEPPEPDPGRGCDDHPGGGDAVVPDDDDDNHGGGYAGGGGVPAESGESVPGSGAASCCD